MVSPISKEYTQTDIGVVKIVEKATGDNGFFYLVENVRNRQTYYVSAIFGNVARHSKDGDTYDLVLRENDFASYYVLLERLV